MEKQKLSFEINRIFVNNLWSWRNADIVWGRVNLLIGPNSSGKSNLFYMMAKTLDTRFDNINSTLAGTAIPLRRNSDFAQITMSYFETNELTISKVHYYGLSSIQIEPASNNLWKQENANLYIIVKDPMKIQEYLNNINSNSFDLRSDWYQRYTKQPARRGLNIALSAMGKNGNISNKDELKEFHKTVIVSPKRKISGEHVGNPAVAFDRSDYGWIFDGGNIKRLLLNLKNASSLSEQQRFEDFKDRFERLSFIQGSLIVSGTMGGDASISIDYGDFQIPIEDEGAGIQDTIIIMTALEIHRGKIIMIEEPETHLHPGAQKELFDVIMEYSKFSQIFISSHSSVFVNLVKSNQIYLVNQIDNISIINHLTDEEKFEEIKAILGIDNSDGLFSNSIVLVEGKSDKLVFQELFQKLTGLSNLDVRFESTQNRTNLARVFSNLICLNLNVPAVILDQDERGEKKTIAKFWEPVLSMLKSIETVNLEQIMKATKILTIKPHMEALLLKDPKAIAQWLNVDENIILDELEKLGKTSPKEKLEKLAQITEANGEYNSIAAWQIASKFDTTKLPPKEIKFLKSLI